MLSDSIHTLSVRSYSRLADKLEEGDVPMLCASSKTTMASFDISFETCSATLGSRR